MRLSKFTTAATLALSLTWQVTVADEPSATDQCMQLTSTSQKVVLEDLIPICSAAAKESREGMVIYGNILAAQGDVESAIDHYSKAIRSVRPSGHTQTTLAALRRRATTYYDTDRHTLAFQDAVVYLDHKPDDADIQYLASATASSAESGLPYVERAIALRPDEILYYGMKARLLVRVGKKNEALAAADEAIKIAPEDARGLIIKGVTYGAIGEYAKAERVYAQAVRAAPKDPQPKVNRASALIELRRFEEAIALTSAVLQDDPNHIQALQTRSTAYLAMGDGDAALADIERAKESQPQWNASDAQAHAEKLISTHRTLSPASIVQLEADRSAALHGITRHLHARCGNFRVPTFSASMNTDAVNADLNAYRTCVTQWLKTPGLEIHDSLTQAEIDAGGRLYDAHLLVQDADALRCSKMPKRSKCIQDAAFTKAAPLLHGVDDKFALVAHIEVERFNSGLAVLRKDIARHNRGVEISDFIGGLAEALNE